jgi:antitoxin component YwqK of YwqJK toxin-antitoxin module
MHKTKLIQILLFSTLLIVVIFLASFCEEEYVPESSLEMRDTLIYKKGSDIPFTGREKAKVKDKVIEYDIVNGLKQGEFIIYYENGNMQIKGQMENNRNVGKWQYFYETGEIESEGYFVDDQPEGRWVWYSPSGKLKEEGSYKQGRRIGKWKTFDENGNVMQEKEFSFDDTTNATEKFFDQFNQSE